MSKSPIIFGALNKKILLPFFLTLGQIVYKLFIKYYPEPKYDLVAHFYMQSLGEMLIKFVPYIFKFDKEEKLEKFKNQNKPLNYFLLILFFLLDGILNVALKAIGLFVNNEQATFDQSNLFPPNDFEMMSIEMIFLVCVSICLLKYKYFRHHIISIIIFIIIGTICEIILNDHSNINGTYFLLEFIKIFLAAANASYYCYQKYMMEKLFYNYWTVAFIPGLVTFIIACIFLIAVLCDPEKENTTVPIFSDFYLFYTQSDIGLLIGKIIIDFILHLIMCPLAILVLYYFTPDYILIILQLTRTIQNLMEESVDKLYCIIFYIIQFIALMIHLEILELNFCGLNRYTKRRIEVRGIEDIYFEGRDSTVDANIIPINDDYYYKKENAQAHIEMKESSNEK